jgi:hypothetical protein
MQDVIGLKGVELSHRLHNLSRLTLRKRLHGLILNWEALDHFWLVLHYDGLNLSLLGLHRVLWFGHLNWDRSNR